MLALAGRGCSAKVDGIETLAVMPICDRCFGVIARCHQSGRWPSVLSARCTGWHRLMHGLLSSAWAGMQFSLLTYPCPSHATICTPSIYGVQMLWNGRRLHARDAVKACTAKQSRSQTKQMMQCALRHSSWALVCSERDPGNTSNSSPGACGLQRQQAAWYWSRCRRG